MRKSAMAICPATSISVIVVVVFSVIVIMAVMTHVTSQRPVHMFTVLMFTVIRSLAVSMIV